MSTLVVVFHTSRMEAQNLVPNWDFEAFSDCQDPGAGLITVSLSVGWQSYSNTPDYFNACGGTSCGWCVPENFIATQAAHSGQAYMGLFAYYSSQPGEMDFREYIGIDLLTPLLIGETYYASMYVCLAGDSTPVYDYFQGSQAANNNMGILFTNMTSTLPDSYLEELIIPERAHVWAADIISDTVEWTLISGSFVTDSSYQRLIFGNLFTNQNTLHTSIHGNPFELAYYLVDDVCVSLSPSTCPRDLSDASSSLSVPNVFTPNGDGVNETFDVQYVGRGPFLISVYNRWGALVFRSESALNDWRGDADGVSVTEGIYFFTCTAGTDQHSGSVTLLR